MDTSEIVARGGKPESERDRARHEQMKLKNLFGGPKFFYNPDLTQVCLKCVFDEDAHTCGRGDS